MRKRGLVAAALAAALCLTLGVSLSLAATPPGGPGVVGPDPAKRQQVAEALGLTWTAPDQPGAQAAQMGTVKDPAKLAKLGFKGVKAGDKVTVKGVREGVYDVKVTSTNEAKQVKLW